MVKKVSNKNGIIELFRFLCSVWVAYFHGFIPILSDKFDGVNISVDFFFMVAGFFFLKSIDRFREKPLWQGIRFIVWGRISRFVAPLIIAALSVLWCNTMIEFKSDGFNFPFSFLWFFIALFSFLSVLFLLYKKIKRIFIFNIVCAVIICLSMSFHKLGLSGIDILARGPAMVTIGILISQIPQIKVISRNEIKSRNYSLIINAICFGISLAAFLYLAYLPEFTIWKLHLFTCVVCPMFIYFAVTLPIHGKFFNFLGECSIYIYLAQCPLLLHYYYLNQSVKEYFIWLCIYAVAMFVINRIVNYIIKKRKAIV